MPTATPPFSKRFKSQWWRHLLGIIAVVFAAFPLVYVLSVSLAPGGTLTGSNKLFSQTDFSNYSKLVSDPVRPYAQWYLNTLIIAAVTAVLTVFLGALAAYSFSRMRFKGRRAVGPHAGADVPAAADGCRHLPTAYLAR